MAQSLSKRMMKYFGLIFKKKNLAGSEKQVFPAKKDPHSGDFKNSPVDYTPTVERYMKEYFADTYETRISLRDRTERYNALDAMVKNDGYVNQAVDTYCDEATQTDAQSQILQVTAESELQKWIYDFIENIGITEEVIRDATYNVVLFGDCFWVHDITEKGIVGIYPITPYSVTDRLEFNPVQVSQLMKKRYGAMYNIINSNSILKGLTDVMISDKEIYSTSDYFRSYLFGYSLEDGDLFLPPWGVTHFRRFVSQSEFWPFGRPLLINTVSPYKQVHAAKIIQAALRANSFPIKVWEIDTGDFSTSSDKWNAISEFKDEFQNLGFSQSQGESVVAPEFFMPKDQAELTVHDPNTDLNQIADIENLEENMVTSTGIPPSFILPGQGGFGNSGEALLRQDKKFARRVYTVQSAILEGITNLIHLQMALTGDYDYKKANFELSMHYPVAEETSDKMRSYSDSLRLATEIITSISTTMGLERDEALPPSIVKSILSNYSFLPSSELSKWLDEIEKMKSKNTTLTESRIKERMSFLTENVALEEYFKAKERLSLKEGVISMRHYSTSKNVSKESKSILEILSKESKKGNSLKEALTRFDKGGKDKIEYSRKIDDRAEEFENSKKQRSKRIFER